MFEEKLIAILSRFNHLLHAALALALLIASAMVIWEFSMEVSTAILHNHMVRGFLQSLGTLFLVWTLSSLISAEISYLQDGVLQVRLFIEVAIITLLRQVITKPVMLATGKQNPDDIFDPTQYGLLLAALLVVGILHWLVGSANISSSNKKLQR
jgi:uncharacterized membrane protein (DUF373 family)